MTQDPARLTPAELDMLMIRSAEIDLSIGTLQQMMQSLNAMYEYALKNP